MPENDNLAAWFLIVLSFLLSGAILAITAWALRHDPAWDERHDPFLLSVLPTIPPWPHDEGQAGRHAAAIRRDLWHGGNPDDMIYVFRGHLALSPSFTDLP